jgi:hypothetical protein
MLWCPRPLICVARYGMDRTRKLARRSILSGVTFVILALSLASCGGESQLALPETPSPAPVMQAQPSTPSIAPLTAPTPSIGGVIWTTDIDPATDAPVDAVTRYFTDAPRIIAALFLSDVPPGSSIEAKWTYNDTSLDTFATQLSVDGLADERWISFHLDRSPDVPWPSGIYEIVVSLDGAPLQQSSVEVLDPE